MTWLNNLRIYKKFLLLSVIILFFLLSLGVVGVWGTSRIREVVDDLSNDQIPELISIGETITEIEANESSLHLALLQTEPAAIEKYLNKSKASIQIVQKNVKAYLNSSAHSADEIEVVKSMKSGFEAWQVKIDNALKLIEANTLETKKEAIALESQEEFDDLRDSLQKVIELNRDEPHAIASQTFTTVLVALGAVSLFLIAFTLLSVFVIANSINSRLVRIRKSMTALAQGDLTQEVKYLGKDELGELGQTYNVALQALRMLVEQLHTQSQQVSSATYELSLQAKNQVTGSNQQAGAITEITHSLGELGEAANHIASQAQETTSASETALRQAQLVSQVSEEMAQSQELGRANVAQTIQTLHKLKEQVGAIEERQQELKQQSEVIQKVIGIIDNIARETHLLALNAAIEAAGAGQFGDRFAVIAGEVKRLANNSVNATNEVRKSLEGIAEAVERSNQSAIEGVRQAEKATTEANQSDNTLLTISQLSEQVKTAARAIVVQIDQVTLLASGIGVSTQQQQAASQQVLQTMLSIEAVTAQNLGSIRQGEIATQQLSSSAHDLERSANIFKLAA